MSCLDQTKREANEPRSTRRLNAIRPIAERHGESVARVALAWLLHQKSVTSVIIGAKTAEQLADNIAAAELQLTQDDLAALEKASALTPEYPRWMVDRQNSARVPPPFAKAG
jgi:aryl-alcohol dehydrogenase-like predicted oxidoreductase